jgi:hypothetical protein
MLRYRLPSKAGTYRIAGGVDIHGTMRAAGAAVTVGGKHC